jgi:hypothetical protein
MASHLLIQAVSGAALNLARLAMMYTNSGPAIDDILSSDEISSSRSSTWQSDSKEPINIGAVTNQSGLYGSSN